MRSSSNKQRKSILHAPPQVNIALDVLSALLFASLASTGAILMWRLPPGGGHGRGGAPTLLGLGRHDWGEIHFWIAATALALVLVHVVLHWTWIRAFWPKMVRWGSHSVGIVALAGIALLLAAPFLIPVDVSAEASGGGCGHRAEPPHAQHAQHAQQESTCPHKQGGGEWLSEGQASCGMCGSGLGHGRTCGGGRHRAP